MRILEGLLEPDFFPLKESCLANSRLTAVTALDIEVQIRLFTADRVDYARSHFDAILVESAQQAEVQVSSFRIKGNSTSTIGYVFPVASLKADSNGLPEKWLKIYAHAGIEFLVLDGIANHLLKKVDIGSLVSGVDIADILPSSLSIVVLGRQQLEADSLDLDSLRLMIQEHGFRLARSPQHQILPSVTPGFQERLSLRRLAPSLSGYAAGLASMMDLANRERNGAARFIFTYQIVELFLDRVFCLSIASIASDPSLTLDPWALKEKLVRSTGDLNRLRRLVEVFLPGNGRMNFYLDNIKRKSCDLINNILSGDGEVYDEEKADWADALYKVRNYVVHKQFMVLGIGDELIHAVCDALQDFCYEALEIFKENNQPPVRPDMGI